MSCLGDVAAALADGELDHAARERAQRHLAHCVGCRVTVDGQRRLKTRLAAVRNDPAPSIALMVRLLALPAGVTGVTPAAPSRPSTPRSSTGPTGVGPTGVGPSGVRPARRSRRVRRGAQLGSAVLALGLGAALVLGGAGAAAPRTPTTVVDPGTGVFVAELVSTSGGAGARP